MNHSVITSKGQTTIPKEIRDKLNIGVHDTIVYIVVGKKVYLTPVKGTILDLKGAIKHRGENPIDFHKLRETVKEKVTKEIDEELK